MSDYAIKVEGLGKKYLLQHQATGKRYVALRDVLAEKAKAFFGGRRPEAGSRKSVEEFWALKDVSFEIKPGEVVGIIGRNGAGKSTLLKLLSRITEPTTGRVRLRGRVASLLEVGTGFHPELTGRENIFLNGAILGMHRTEIKKKFDEIVAFAEVEKFLDTPVKRYSSGMYMRLAFAVAAHLEPEILIVDEVLAVGDFGFQQKCLGKMQDVAAGEGRTVVFVSHNMQAVTTLCIRAILLNAGKIVQAG
ncbi:MAG TPA: ABC transporter ATP-binding protein, partial [Verrucomicrobiae bacterium]